MSEQPIDAIQRTSEEAIARLPERLAIIKMHDESIMMAAAARPRDHERILAEVKSQIKAYPSFARAAMYSKPVGKERGSDRQKYVRGLSIRAAEALRNAYGYNKVNVDVDPIDDNRVRVTATFTDYQAGNMWTDSGIVSRIYKRYGGGTARYDDDRFYNVVVKAEASRRVREVVLRSVPPGLKAELEEAIEETIAQLLTPEAVQKIVQAFGKKGVTLEQLETYLDKKAADWDQQDRLNLQGVWNAIEDGETTVAEAFGGESANGSGGGGDTTAKAVTEAVEKARSKSAEAKPAPGDSASSEPPKHEQLCIMLAEKDGCDIEKATAYLNTKAKLLFGKKLHELPKGGWDAIENRIRSGEFTTVDKTESQ